MLYTSNKLLYMCYSLVSGKLDVVFLFVVTYGNNSDVWFHKDHVAVWSVWWSVYKFTVVIDKNFPQFLDRLLRLLIGWLSNVYVLHVGWCYLNEGHWGDGDQSGFTLQILPHLVLLLIVEKNNTPPGFTLKIYSEVM